MPYIDPDRRRELDPLVDELGRAVTSAGDLAYVLARLAVLRAPGSYREYAELVGVLETAKLELYRRKLAPYEDEKMRASGDVF